MTLVSLRDVRRDYALGRSAERVHALQGVTWMSMKVSTSRSSGRRVVENPLYSTSSGDRSADIGYGRDRRKACR